MGFSDDDRILIENLYIFKGYGAKKLIKEFLDKGWGLHGLKKIAEKTSRHRYDSEKKWADDLELAERRPTQLMTWS